MANILKQGIAHFNKKNYEKALSFFSNLDADSLELSEHSEIAYYVGLSFAKLKKIDEAIPYIEQVVTSGESIERINQCRLILGVFYSMTNREKMALFEFNKLLESGYKTANVFCGLAFVAWEQENTELSVEYYEKALQLDSSNPTAMNGLAYVLACLDRDLKRALSLCKKALDYAPESAAFLDSLGWIYYKLGLIKEAKKYIKRAKEINPKAKEILEHYKVVSSIKEQR
ncbi:MAG: tetratricopeptide repeat protein [Treponema sp.]|nr:tetratricopeptide repeat protein [Treponema sp.]